VTERPDIWKVADALQMDLRAASAKMVELRARLAALPIGPPSEHLCPVCALPCIGPKTLAEHLYVSHEGPLPEHWASIEQRSAEPEEVA
jgi:hypothetical protein